MRSFVSFAVGRVQAHLCATCIVWYASSALAQAAPTTEPSGYRVLIGEALAEFDRGNAAEARALFMRAHALNPSARTLRGLGLASFELRDYRAAVDYLEQSLASDANPLPAPLRESTMRLLVRAHGYVGRFRLQLEPPDARVRLDGVAHAGESLLTLDVGTHELVVEAPGRMAARHTVRVTGGEETTLGVALLPLPSAVAAAAEPSPKAGPKRALSTDVERPTARPLYRNGWLWAGIGTAVVSASIAAIVVARRSERTEVGEPTLTAGTPTNGVFSALGYRP
jgi:tetratricopeptide (TPR) repeat protein